MANGIYPLFQSAYRQHHSTETTLLRVMNDILLKMNSHYITLLVYWISVPGGGGTPIWNRRGCSSEILNLTPKGDHLGVAQAFCDP